MTLCIAWIRKQNDEDELVFATDSALTGGEKWNSGVKLFELPRRDCLICFAGETYRAYPMILNLISELKTKPELLNLHTDISRVVSFLAELFTSLTRNLIAERSNTTVDDLAAEASFLFGGWSWQEGRFRIWEVFYAKDAKGFLHKEQTVEKEKSRVVVFLGNPAEIGQEAEKKYQEVMTKKGKFDANLDMEPALILAEIAKNNGIREVDGAPQVGKILRSGTTQFFGVRWPSVDGKPTFLGREFSDVNKPSVRYFDPDTFELLEEDLPASLLHPEEFASHPDAGFIKGCYGDAENSLRLGLSDFDREKLLRILRDHAYRLYVSPFDQKGNS